MLCLEVQIIIAGPKTYAVAQCIYCTVCRLYSLQYNSYSLQAGACRTFYSSIRVLRLAYRPLERLRECDLRECFELVCAAAAESERRVSMFDSSSELDCSSLARGGDGAETASRVGESGESRVAVAVVETQSDIQLGSPEQSISTREFIFIFMQMNRELRVNGGY